MRKLASVALGLSLLIGGINVAPITVNAALVAYSGTHYANAFDYHNPNEMDMRDLSNKR